VGRRGVAAGGHGRGRGRCRAGGEAHNRLYRAAMRPPE
jgi:hypothetical protein